MKKIFECGIQEYVIIIIQVCIKGMEMQVLNIGRIRMKSENRREKRVSCVAWER